MGLGDEGDYGLDEGGVIEERADVNCSEDAGFVRSELERRAQVIPGWAME
jgi:hypothetical protein